MFCRNVRVRVQVRTRVGRAGLGLGGFHTDSGLRGAWPSSCPLPSFVEP